MKHLLLILSIACISNIYAGEPTVQASNGMVTTKSCIDARIQWTNGNGGWRLVLVKEASNVDADPQDGTKYSGWYDFGNAPSDQIGTGNWVVFNGISDNVTLTNLKQNTTYYVKIYEHDGNSTSPDYLTTNPASFSFTTHNISFNFDFFYTDSCQNTNSVIFKNKSVATFGWLTYRWRYNDSKTDTGFNAIHTYTKGGFYNVRLEAFPTKGCKDNWTNPKSFFIVPRPKSQANVNDSVQCFQGHEFQFSDLTTMDPVPKCSYGRTWWLGDNTINTMPSFKKTYAKPKTFKIHYVSETYYNNVPTGCQDSSNFTVRLIDNPSVGVSVDDSLQCFAGNNFTFDNVSPNLIKYSWNFGDGNNDNTKSPSHSYSSTGTFRVIHSAESVEGCSSIDTIFVWVKPEKDGSWKISKDSICYKAAPIKLIPNVTGGKFFGTNVSNDTFKPLTPGIHTLKYVVSDTFCPDSSTQDIKVIALPYFTLGPDLTICDGNPATVSIGAGKNFLWNDGSVLQSRQLINPGNYWAQAEESSCFWRDSLSIFSGAPPAAALGPDTLLCKGSILRLVAKWPNSKVQWNNGSTDSVIYVTKSGTYSVTISNPCGTFTDQVVINYQDKDCDIIIPNAFSPDGNGVNDVFKIIGRNNVVPKRLMILNRWGEMLYDSQTSGKIEWDGIYGGQVCQSGMYTFLFQYNVKTGGFERRNSTSGVIMLLK